MLIAVPECVTFLFGLQHTIKIGCISQNHLYLPVAHPDSRQVLKHILPHQHVSFLRHTIA